MLCAGTAVTPLASHPLRGHRRRIVQYTPYDRVRGPEQRPLGTQPGNRHRTCGPRRAPVQLAFQ